MTNTEKINEKTADFEHAVYVFKTTIIKAMTDALHQFEQTTGVTPSDITIVMLANQSLGKPRRYFVGGLDLTFKF